MDDDKDALVEPTDKKKENEYIAILSPMDSTEGDVTADPADKKDDITDIKPRVKSTSFSVKIENNASEQRPRSKSAKLRRANSVVRSRTGTCSMSRDGKRLIKSPSHAADYYKREEERPVTLFRLNSLAVDKGEKKVGSDEPERQQWDNPIEFLLSCISMSVGLGNVWRFPFTAYENGGGAFLIPYVIVLLLVGRPLYLLELGLGQFSSAGSVRIWDMVPAFGGVGYGQAVATGCVTTYYCSLIALAIYYLVASCYPVLPWTLCHDQFESETQICIPSGANMSAYITCHYPNQTSLNSTICTPVSVPASDVDSSTVNMTIISSAEQYFRTGVLKEKTDISEGLGLPDPTLAGCLAVCWLLLYLTLRNGVSSSGKVAYFTAIFPYVVMLTLLVRGLTLPGASKGLKFFFTPVWEKLLSLKVWYAAVTQSFFSLGVGFGTLTTYSSYNKFRHNTAKDALIISFADTFTSLLAGTVIFSILGHLAHELDLPVKEVVKSGAGLAFVSYPEVLAKFTFAPQVFAVLFFLMLITLGLGSAVGFMSAVTTTICDSFPDTNRKLIVKICCVVGLGIGLFYVTPGGQLMLEMVDYFGGTVLILILASIEMIGISWVYGTSRITRDFNFMLSKSLSLYWRICWGILNPILLPLLFLYVLFTQAGVPNIPLPAKVFGWALSLTGFLIVPIHFFLTLFGSDDDDEDEELGLFARIMSVFKSGKIGQKFTETFKPNDTWGPSELKERADWQIYCEQHSLYEWLPKCIRRKIIKRNKSEVLDGAIEMEKKPNKQEVLNAGLEMEKKPDKHEDLNGGS